MSDRGAEMTSTMQTIKNKMAELIFLIEDLEEKGKLTWVEHAKMSEICIKVINLIETEMSKTPRSNNEH